MYRTLAVATALVLAIASPVTAQEWQVEYLGPGSTPGTILVEVSGTPGDPGECGPSPLDACDVYWMNIDWDISPCPIAAIDAAASGCKPTNYMEGVKYAPLFDRFSMRFELDPAESYTLTGRWNYFASVGIEQGGGCDGSNTCSMGYLMSPDPMEINLAVPSTTLSWGTLKTTYHE